VRPLLSVITYNRKEETRQTLQSLLRTGAFEDADVIIWDNGSTDGTAEMLREMLCGKTLPESSVIFSMDNVGCPRALNYIMRSSRRKGQHFIKVDNDVVLETNNWVIKLVAFLEQHEHVAMASAWYDELKDDSQRGRFKARHNGWFEAFPIVGHCVIHRGSFLDRTGYFDVLAPDHLYGFEDVLMAHRAATMKLKCAVVPEVRLKNIQRHSSLDTSPHEGETTSEHVERLRPKYQERISRIHLWQGRYYAGPLGEEADA
jgi:GT2 family glycosyltransferase